MSQRDELARVIENAAADLDLVGDVVTPSRLADAILAAGYARPRVVDSIEEFDQLPVGTLIPLNRGREAT